MRDGHEPLDVELTQVTPSTVARVFSVSWLHLIDTLWVLFAAYEQERKLIAM